MLVSSEAMLRELSRPHCGQSAGWATGVAVQSRTKRNENQRLSMLHHPLGDWGDDKVCILMDIQQKRGGVVGEGRWEKEDLPEAFFHLLP
jgi:hypothetical protein